MMNLFKNLSKTSKTLNTPKLNQFSPNYFSTKFPPNQQQKQNPNSQINQIDQSNDKKIKTLAKLTQIPYQSKVSNWIHLIGTIKNPIKFLNCDHGDSWAATIISQEQFPANLGPLWMPVVFQGDLAWTAMMHLKESDTVYIAGHLSPEPLPINLTNNQTNIQVLVHDVYFVRGLNGVKKKFPRTFKGSS
ncbi:hypothetical protein vseg_016308 [Gypsophila vaccaria]